MRFNAIAPGPIETEVLWQSLNSSNTLYKWPAFCQMRYRISLINY